MGRAMLQAFKSVLSNAWCWLAHVTIEIIEVVFTQGLNREICDG